MGQKDRQLMAGVGVGFNLGQAFLGKCLSVQMVFDEWNTLGWLWVESR